jgi:uncharacterized Zn finger protein (UPF0148 family)
MIIQVETREIVCQNCVAWFAITKWNSDRGGVRCPACGCDPWTKGKPSPEARAQVHCEDAEKEAAKLRERVEKAEARIDDYQRLHQADAERIAYLESERDGARNELEKCPHLDRDDVEAFGEGRFPSLGDDGPYEVWLRKLQPLTQEKI